MQQKIANFIGRFVTKNWLLLTFIFIACFVRVFFNYKGQTDLFEFPFKVEVWGTFADWVAAIATVLTLIIAGVALYSWRHQKLFDLEIEAKANAWKAADYIFKYTTVPITAAMLTGDDAQRFKNLTNESADNAACHLEAFVIEYVRKCNEQRFYELNTIAETVKAQFFQDKERENIYAFYRLFVKSYFDIYHTAFEYCELKKKRLRGEKIDDARLNYCYDFFYNGGLQEIAKAIGNAQSLVIVDPKENHNKARHFR